MGARTVLLQSGRGPGDAFAKLTLDADKLSATQVLASEAHPLRRKRWSRMRRRRMREGVAVAAQ
jgi:hypothetical protein